MMSTWFALRSFMDAGRFGQAKQYLFMSSMATGNHVLAWK